MTKCVSLEQHEQHQKFGLTFKKKNASQNVSELWFVRTMHTVKVVYSPRGQVLRQAKAGVQVIFVTGHYSSSTFLVEGLHLKFENKTKTNSA